MRRPTILLFDIDGTILDVHHAGRRAIQLAFGERYQRHDACDSFSFGGMTDIAIVKQGLAHIDQPSNTLHIAKTIDCYLQHLELQLKHTAATCFVGIRETIERAKSSGHAVGLGTGNVRHGAFLKLSQVGLGESDFSFGGYGDDAEMRSELVAAGASRGAAQLAISVNQARVVIIGDTPKDVEAARANGAECLAVTTGGFGAQALKEAGATVVVDSLIETAAQQFLF
jgi:phosphoglycolate phosphatase